MGNLLVVDPNAQARSGAERLLLDVFWYEVWVLFCKSYARVSTYVLSKFNHTHGGG